MDVQRRRLRTCVSPINIVLAPVFWLVEPKESFCLNRLHVIIVSDGEYAMEISEQRVIGSLLLLLGMTFLTIGLYSGQLRTVLEIMKTIFEASVAGLP